MSDRTDAGTHKHRCLRCHEEFECYSPDVCTAQYDVLPFIARLTPSGGVETFQHCAIAAQNESGVVFKPTEPA